MMIFPATLSHVRLLSRERRMLMLDDAIIWKKDKIHTACLHGYGLPSLQRKHVRGIDRLYDELKDLQQRREAIAREAKSPAASSTSSRPA